MSAPTILVVNCNTDAAMSEAIAGVARTAASAGTRIVPVTPAWGPASAEGYVESFASAVATMDAVAAHAEPFDAVVMAGFGEHGREGMRQLVRQPVVDITEASAYLACLVAHRFGIVTTLPSTLAGIDEALRTIGLSGRCAAMLASGVPVLHAGTDPVATADTLEATAREALARGADAIVLGCAGFAGLDAELERRLGVPVLDGVACATRLAEDLVALGKRTSTRGPYAPRDAAKHWEGPPLGARPAPPPSFPRR
ncbi:aspartate/glutamate racemase family protein [Microbacterium sp. No. 7]|uniref:aspartate/glutamate racemase family protein n=1 Tax=Microbacterium sp. No. 7 TaxID=1714373 RepID=UPI0006ECF611|nr:AroM family protein [Microbacterium sp. No. 7]ALJ20135.1 hypothetical protein AOA12_09510 [Microbacterium sp. No. 7]